MGLAEDLQAVQDLHEKREPHRSRICGWPGFLRFVLMGKTLA